MRLLISDTYKVALGLGEPDEPVELTVHLMNLTGKERVEVLKASHIFSNEIYSAISTSSAIFTLEKENRSLFQVLLIHINQYKNNLYGIHLKNQGVHRVEGLSSLIEGYVRRFAIEISACFESCSHDDLELLTKQIEKEIVHVGRDYEEALDLQRFLTIWNESRSGAQLS